MLALDLEVIKSNGAMLHATAFEDATGGSWLDQKVIYCNGAMLHATAFEDATGGSWL